MIPLDNKTIIQKLFKIRDKRGNRVPFKLNTAQLWYWQKKTRRNLILKARQKGLSKIIDADQLVDCIRKFTNAVVISHEKGATSRLFAAVKYFVDNLEIKPAVSIDSKSEMKFPKRGSSYFIGTAGQRAFGRGDTINRAHLSEAAFYLDLEKILAGISEAAEYGQIDMETTANGRGQFYDQWQKAKIGKSPYTAIFIPWFIDSEYSIDSMTEDERHGLSVGIQKMFSIPDDEFIAGLSIEEKQFVSKVASEYGMVLTAGQLKWRRYKIWDKGEFFWQEYPEDDETCFLQSGRAVFSHILLDKEQRVPLDDISQWKTPEDRERLKKRIFYAGVDGAEGTLEGDSHSFAVIDASASKSQAAVIYEYTSNEPIDVFWLKIDKICKQFRISLGIEKNGVGVAHVQKAKQLRVRHKEWETTAANRPMMITDLEEAYRKEYLVETYPEAENEARDMIYTKTNRAEHRPGKHDDRIFARAIAWQMKNRPVPGITNV